MCLTECKESVARGKCCPLHVHCKCSKWMLSKCQILDFQTLPWSRSEARSYHVRATEATDACWRNKPFSASSLGAKFVPDSQLYWSLSLAHLAAEGIREQAERASEHVEVIASSVGNEKLANLPAAPQTTSEAEEEIIARRRSNILIGQRKSSHSFTWRKALLL